MGGFEDFPPWVLLLMAVPKVCSLTISVELLGSARRAVEGAHLGRTDGSPARHPLGDGQLWHAQDGDHQAWFARHP